MTDLIYNSFKQKIMAGEIDLDTHQIKCALVTDGYSPDMDTHDFWDDVSANEASGTGYTPGGQALTGKTVTQDNVDDEGVWDAGNVSWPNSYITAYGAVLYRDTGTPSTSPLICYFGFGENKTTENGTFELQWNAEGIVNAG